jgi:6-pyruvoyl-tetrahydropterin synthase
MAIVSLTRVVHFSASHRLHVRALSGAKNRALFGKCNNPAGHGHNYTAEVTVTGEVDAATGMVFNLDMLKKILNDTVLKRLDHRNLNVEVTAFRKLNPTAENIAIEIHRMVQKHLPKTLKLEVKLFETPNNSVVYRGEIK